MRPTSYPPTGMVLLICPDRCKDRLAGIVRGCGLTHQIVARHSAAELSSTVFDDQFFKNGTLVCFNTGVLVPADLLAKVERPSYNFHAASPEFPGRDPHHWAIYRGARWYGVTAHIMTEKVDAGPIVAVEEFDIPDGCSPLQLKDMATEKLFELFERVIPHILFGPIDARWGTLKTTRKQLLDLCDLRGVDEAEAARRRHAFDGFPIKS